MDTIEQTLTNESTSRRSPRTTGSPDPGHGWDRQDRTSGRSAPHRPRPERPGRVPIDDTVVRVERPDDMGPLRRGRGRGVHRRRARPLVPRRRRDDRGVLRGGRRARRGATRPAVGSRRGGGGGQRTHRGGVRCGLDGAPGEFVRPELQRALPARPRARRGDRPAGRNGGRTVRRRLGRGRRRRRRARPSRATPDASTS